MSCSLSGTDLESSSAIFNLNSNRNVLSTLSVMSLNLPQLLLEVDNPGVETGSDVCEDKEADDG